VSPRTLLALALAAGLALGPLVAAQTYAGASSHIPANGYDAPIFRQFAFVEGVVTQYHVLKPNIFVTDNGKTRIYQFPQCPSLQPVLQAHTVPGVDAPTRQVVDVTLRSGCSIQPRSEADVLALAGVGAMTGVGTNKVGAIVERSLWVNAPKIPARIADLPDDKLFNAPPYRPRITAWEEGQQVKFITYEASWYPSWLGTNFPAQDADVFIISYAPIFQEGFTILNVAAGTPHHTTFRAYSPIWKANCIVKSEDPRCEVSVHQPEYEQCFSVAECASMEGVEIIAHPMVSHINCPMVSVDLDRDRHIAPHEELLFPDLWVHGPVLA
jgi:hypothetical protein